MSGKDVRTRVATDALVIGAPNGDPANHDLAIRDPLIRDPAVRSFHLMSHPSSAGSTGSIIEVKREN